MCQPYPYCPRLTIPRGFHPYPLINGRKCVKTGPNSVANSLRYDGAHPKALDGLKPFKDFVTPSFVTTISSMNGADLSRVCTVSVNTCTSVN